MTWYAQIEDELYGPVGLETLQYWAAEGLLLAEHRISQDPDADTWSSPGDLEALDMSWQIELSEGERSAPVHLLALRDQLASGELDPDAQIIHRSSGEAYPLVDALCAALLEQNRHLQEMLTETSDQLSEIQTATVKAVPEVADLPAAGAGADETFVDARGWKNLMQLKDQNEKETVKWRRFYEDEVKRNQEREGELVEEIEALRLTHQELSDRVKSLERKRRQLEENYSQLYTQVSSRPESGEMHTNLAELQRSYSELSESFDQLLDDYQEKSRQLDEAFEERDGAETHARERIGQMEQIVVRERDRSRKARGRLTELEQVHNELLRSYRELNTRLVNVRNRIVQPASGPMAAAAPPAPEPTSAAAKEEKQAAPKTGKPARRGPSLRLK